MTIQEKFEQLLKLRESMEKKETLFLKAKDKYDDFCAEFGECSNKLFKLNGKTYIVTSWNKKVFIEEAEE